MQLLKNLNVSIQRGKKRKDLVTRKVIIHNSFSERLVVENWNHILRPDPL